MVRSVVNNPFQPGAGAVPRIWVGRIDELADVEQRLVPRRGAGLFERGRAYLGDPGLGKSVLVNRIAEERAAAGDLVAAPLRMARGRDPLAALAGALEPLTGGTARGVGSVMDALARVEEVGLLGARLGVRGSDEDAYASLERLLDSMAAQARSVDRLLVIRVDEVQNIDADGLSQILTLLGDLLEREVAVETRFGESVTEHLPVLVLISGLPSFTQAAADAGATFSRRFATWYLEPFSDAEVRAALEFSFGAGLQVPADDGPAVVGMRRAAMEVIVERCMGDPFLFQLAGAAAWDAGSGGVITEDEAQAGWQRVRREVDGHVRGMLAPLTELQRTALTAAARLGDPVDGTAIAQAMGRERSSAIGSTLQALVTKRVLAHDPGGYRVISRSLAAHLRDGRDA